MSKEAWPAPMASLMEHALLVPSTVRRAGATHPTPAWRNAQNVVHAKHERGSPRKRWSLYRQTLTCTRCAIAPRGVNEATRLRNSGKTSLQPLPRLAREMGNGKGTSLNFPAIRHYGIYIVRMPFGVSSINAYLIPITQQSLESPRRA